MGTTFSIRSPKTTEEWQAYYHFRWQQLRAPWSQPEGSEKDELEKTARHCFAISQTGHVLACGRLHQLNVQTGQIRYMAVVSEQRKRGLGKAILQTLESMAIESGMSLIILHAREHAVSFYEYLGYQAIEPSHTLYNSIRHVKMEKSLTGENLFG